MPKPLSTQSSAHIRWMIRRDMPAVLGIENESFEFPWTEDEFIRCLRQRDCIGMVAEYSEQVVGFMIYELHRTRIHVLSFAVHPDFRRQSVGSAMITKLVSKLAYQRRNRIVLEVRETNLSAQLFFRSLGFRATGVLRNFYEDSTEDAFMMQLQSITPEEAIEAETAYGQRKSG
jgi:ribosomal-protein-alanine N-acetyltransferase